MNPWKLFKSDPCTAQAARLYDAVVAQARQPAFYAMGGVPDTIDGRFEMIALHTFLVLRRLRTLSGAGEPLAQALVDILFSDMDASLREMGAGDLGVGKRVKRMATAFYGRVAAYESAEKAGDMQQALARNLFGTVAPSPRQLAAMAAYVDAARATLSVQPLAELEAARPNFPLPVFPDGVLS
jgi:cytochrome b pre-mRNA-processing protein 3